MVRQRKLWRVLSLLLIVAASIGGGVQAQTVPGTTRVILRTGDEAARATLLARGAVPLADYGAFSLWQVEEIGAAGLDATPAISTHPEFGLLLLREATLDTRMLSARLEPRTESGLQLSLVQFVGPVRDVWLADLETTGARPIAYVPHNGYVVWGDTEARALIAARVASQPEYQWQGAYAPAYRLAGALAALPPTEVVDVVVQVVNHERSESSVAEVLAQASAVLREPHTVLEYTNLTVRLPAGALPALAARADVINIEPWQAPHRHDERQGQILAGNLTVGGTQPSGPGYLNWLDGIGFPQSPSAYPIVDVIDDGFDNGSASQPGHADFRQQGSYSLPSRMAYARDLTGSNQPRSLGSHGTINVSIVGGYNHYDGSELYEDSAGYQYGLGISPYGRMASTKVFDDYGNWAYTGSYADLFAGAYAGGARITNSSWGSPNDAYTADSQAYDALTRDADPFAPGHQQMTHVVSAGNFTETLSSPGTAKNVITVGASEGYRPSGTDGCGLGPADANNLHDLAVFSSYGPTADSRVKPDLVAPGTHIQGAVSQDPLYWNWPGEFLGVCDRYWPSGQTLYTWSSGTSHSAPAVAGALSLIYTYLAEGMGSGTGATPSPAMLKAYLLNAARYLDGVGTGGDLPSYTQGWGMPDLGRAFDDLPRMLVDQSRVFDESGQSYQLTGRVADAGEPFRVTLAWTDAPGTPSAPYLINNLDLEVTVGGQTYRGNVYAGAHSTTGGAFDAQNNVESIFLPAGVSGPFTVRLIALGISGNGVPDNGDPTDQDFALVVYNGEPEPDFAVEASPALAQVCGADTVTYTVSVEGLDGYDRTVSLAHGAPPPNGQAALLPSSGTPPYAATLLVTATATTAPGRYTVAVTGTGELAGIHATSVTLDIDDAAPVGTVTPISPTDAITGVAPRPLFTWDAVPGVRTYALQVAGHEAFEPPLVLDEIVEGISYRPETALLADATYYWRVVARNGCGSITSTARVFTTVNPVDVFYDTMEDGPGRWTVTTAPGPAQWVLTERRFHSPTHAWYMEAASYATDARLELSQPLSATETSRLSFWHWYDLERIAGTAFALDGGVLEISVDGGPWEDLGGHIEAGGYDHTVWIGASNPLAGRPAWSGNGDGWREVSVDLSGYAGSSVRIRFRWGSNTSNSAQYGGWYVDDVRVSEEWPPWAHKIYTPVVSRGG